MTEPKPVLKFPYDIPSCWTCSNAKTCSDVRDEIFMAGPALTTMDDIRSLFTSTASDCKNYGRMKPTTSK